MNPLLDYPQIVQKTERKCTLPLVSCAQGYTIRALRLKGTEQNMAFLNAQEREELRSKLTDMSFFWAKFRLHRIDPKGRLVYLRNNQNTGKWLTRFELTGLGTRVTLVETYDMVERAGKNRAKFELVDVIVEPTPENRT